MKLRISGLVNDSVVDGPGLRYTVFTQGCPHHCKGCHNPQTHDFRNGYDMDADEILANILKNPLLDGVTFSGGEPFLHSETLTYLAKKIKEKNMNIIAYTGYTWEEIAENPQMKGLAENVDYIIDGKYMEKEKTLDLRFRGSKNQRIVDVKESLAAGRAVEKEL